MPSESITLWFEVPSSLGRLSAAAFLLRRAFLPAFIATGIIRAIINRVIIRLIISLRLFQIKMTVVFAVKRNLLSAKFRNQVPLYPRESEA